MVFWKWKLKSYIQDIRNYSFSSLLFLWTSSRVMSGCRALFTSSNSFICFCHWFMSITDKPLEIISLVPGNIWCKNGDLSNRLFTYHSCHMNLFSKIKSIWNFCMICHIQRRCLLATKSFSPQNEAGTDTFIAGHWSVIKTTGSRLMSLTKCLKA